MGRWATTPHGRPGRARPDTGGASGPLLLSPCLWWPTENNRSSAQPGLLTAQTLWERRLRSPHNLRNLLNAKGMPSGWWETAVTDASCDPRLHGLYRPATQTPFLCNQLQKWGLYWQECFFPVLLRLCVCINRCLFFPRLIPSYIQ